MKQNWRLVAALILLVGFPAWLVYWIKNPNVLIYLYAIFGYFALIVYLGDSGLRRLLRS